MMAAATLVSESFATPGATSRASAVGVYAEASGTYWLGANLGGTLELGRIMWLGGAGSILNAGLAVRWWALVRSKNRTRETPGSPSALVNAYQHSLSTLD